MEEDDGRTFLITESVRNVTVTTNVNGTNITKIVKRRFLNATEINGQQALLNSKNNDTMAVRVVDGEVELCSPGCTDCDCTDCKKKFVKDTESGSCKQCAPNCKRCLENDVGNCTACVWGTFLNSSDQCERCIPSCITC